MNIELKMLRLKNFKGSKETIIEFSNRTNIYGENRSGKTRILDAFVWLLFGKDSQDKADFSIKPLDDNNQPIPKAEVEVEAELLINGSKLSLMKLYKEKWQKKRGSIESELTGHDTTYYIDDVNVLKSKYDLIINDIIKQDMFRYITNPVYFENQNWTVKRKILFEMANIASDNEIAFGNEDFERLLSKLKGRDIVDYKKDIEKTIRAIKQDLDLIPSRIDENNMNLPEVRESKDSIMAKINAIEMQIKKLESDKNNKLEVHESNNKEANEIISQISKVDSKILDIRIHIQSKIDVQKSENLTRIRNLTSDIGNLKERCRIISKEIEQDNIELSSLTEKLEKLRKDWYTVRDSKIVINESQTHCPTCKREFENSEKIIEDLKVNFHNSKVEKIKEIESKADIYKQRRESLTTSIEKLKEELIDKKGRIKELENILKQPTPEPETIEQLLLKSEDYKSLIKEKESLKEQLINSKTELDTSVLDSKLEVERKAHSDLLAKLNIELNAEKTEQRIKELEAEMREKGQKIAEFEKEIIIINEFTRKKIELVESSINAKFKYVKFKLYNRLLNGEDEETCITLINGVPYHSANYASKINAGLDIINALSEHDDVYAPVFIDNRESITDIQHMNTQVINLIKETGATKLRIENE